jgi:hypothetical protein
MDNQLNIKVEGQSLIRVTNSRLSLKSIDSVIITVKPRSEDTEWELLYTTVECIKAKAANQTNATMEPLFGNAEIAESNYRSCLLDPVYFSVINKQIVSIVSEVAYNQRLRSKAIQFVTRIVQKDQRISVLVLKEIDIAKFLSANIFGINQAAMIPVAVEFLKAYQNETEFLQSVFEILISQLKRLPSEIISF